MKKTIGMVTGMVLLVLSATLNAQQVYDAKKNPTVVAITSQYEGKLLPPRPPLTIDQIFPVLGKYEAAVVAETTTDAATAPAQVIVSLDETNKGLIWVEGLPQGKFKAMLRKSPAIYKIPAQKTEDGKDVPEGVLVYDQASNTLKVCVGCTYNSEDPGIAFTVPEPQVVEVPKKLTKKEKALAKEKELATIKPWFFNGTKVIETTASIDKHQ